MKFSRRCLFVSTITSVIGIATSSADLFSHTDGNLLLGFQATGGTGASQNVFISLGSATSFRDNGNLGPIANIGATLTSVYGSDWYTRTDLYFGVIGNLSAKPNSGIGSASAVNGDPSRTFYLSAPAATPGTGNLIAATTYGGTALGAAGTNLNGMENMLKGVDNGVVGGLQAEPDGSAILDQTNQDHNTAWNNGWSRWNPTPGAAFEVFTGGIQQSFGKGGSGTHVDVQRVLSTNTGASPTGTIGGGTYETTISVSPTGAITAATATASSPFSTWMDSFTSLTQAADKLPAADPDHDDVTNLEEFALGGNPASAADQGTRLVQTVDANGDATRDFSLTIEVRSGATFAAAGTAMTATIDEVTYRIEGSANLVTWDSPVSEVTPLGSGSPSAGYVFKTFRLNNGSGLTGKGFLRAVLVK